MPLATLKEKGQITLPADIRRQLQAQKGDLFEFELIDGKIIMTLQKVIPASDHQTTKSKRRDLSQWIGTAPGVF